MNTTPTFSSRHKESKDLADGNAALKAKKEILEREIRELAQSKDEIIRKSGYTPAEYKIIEDEHLKRIEILENRAVKIRIEVENLEKSLTDLYNAITAKGLQLDNVNKQYGKIAADLIIITQRHEDALGATAEANRKYEKLIIEKSKELALVTDKADKAKNANATAFKEIADRMSSVVEQERILAIRRNDLEIYEARLRKKYPNDTIIL